ncbi:NHL repeat-containing protein [Telluribacter sp.]|jgi:sugar lactone lactonase YvrE|uniref:NHL repeat-containing protein n=1 Tax=Telluribacter sp. TaxID=1978767 RepID=UPI002E13DF5F|nr:NHL repeat-containing protein [Telluribacter sp.]
MKQSVTIILAITIFLVVACRQKPVTPDRTVEVENPIITFAGERTGDGAPATQGRFNNPNGLAVDAAGNIYVADTGNNRIRKVTPNGNISTIAGNGTAGFSGDGGVATNASLNSPTGVTVDAAGNIYIADGGNHRVRKVATNGVISTIAGNGTPGFSGDGGVANRASLNNPFCVVVDKAGNLYIADKDNHRIRKVSVRENKISTMAGTGTAGHNGDGKAATSAHLNMPAGVAVDASGNIYIADSGNHRIRKVATNGVISTIAGNGTLGYNGDAMPATNARLNSPIAVAVDAKGNIFIADHWSFRVRKVDGKDGNISTITGNGNDRFGGDGGVASNASISLPSGVAIDAAGSLLITDKGNLRIRKVSITDGTIRTVAGSGNPGFCGDGGTAVSACFSNPTGITVDKKGNVYLVDQGNQRVRMITPKGVVSTVAGNGKDGFTGDGEPATSASLRYPTEVTVDAAGNIYISDSNTNRIRKVNATSGIISTVAGNGLYGYSGDGGPATSASIHHPSGLAFDARGNLYIAEYWSHCVRKVTPDGIISTVAGTGSEGFSGDGSSATRAQLKNPTDVAVDGSGNIYISDRGNHRIRKVSTEGSISTVAGNGAGGFSGDQGAATDASLNGPTGVAVDDKGNIYITEIGNNRIRRVNAGDGIINTVAGNGKAGSSGDYGPATLASLNRPTSIAIDQAGYVYIVDQWNHRIRRFK